LVAYAPALTFISIGEPSNSIPPVRPVLPIVIFPVVLPVPMLVVAAPSLLLILVDVVLSNVSVAPSISTVPAFPIWVVTEPEPVLMLTAAPVPVLRLNISPASVLMNIASTVLKSKRFPLKTKFPVELPMLTFPVL